MVTLLRSAGRPCSARRVTIQDEDGNVLPAGETGEVCAAGGQLHARVLEPSRGDRPTSFRGGWYHTGDAGYLDDDGYLYLVDRVKDMIVTGGENVYSAEVENAVAVASRGRPGGGDRHPLGAVGRGGARHRRAASRE